MALAKTALFAYRRGNTSVHNLPALVKLVLLFALCIVTFYGGSPDDVPSVLSRPLIARMLTCLAISIILFFFAGCSWRSLKNLSFVLVLGAAVTVFRTLGIPGEPTDIQKEYIISVLPGVFLNLNGCAAGILYTVRFFITTFTAQTVFETTSSLEIKGAAESVQNAAAHIVPPLKKWNPALVISLAINFIPQIFDTWNSVHTAARARSNAGKKNLVQTMRITYQELQSLLSCLLFKAETTRKAILNRDIK